MENVLLLLLLLPAYVDAKVNKRATNKNHLCFPVIGDIGGVPYPPFQTPSQKDVAALLAKVTGQLKCKFVLGVGDNFYYTGVANTSDPRFYLTFERTYASTNLPWYMIAGNHDHVRNVSAQIGYSKVSKQWKFPFFYYSEVHAIPDSKRNVEVVMIDTTMLCWHKRKSGAPLPETQMKWIEKKLSESTADYLVVAGHHPILSAGIHGNTECLIEKLKPLLERYKVTAYFSGHDHNLQHIKEDDSDVHYFVSGSGNFVDGRMVNKVKLPQGSLKFENGLLGGFALLRASDKSLRVQILNSEPKELWKLKLFPRRFTDEKNSKRNTSIELAKGDNLNLTSLENSLSRPNVYGSLYPSTIRNTFIQATPNPYYYNNWFFPNQMSPNLNLPFTRNFDIMELTKPRNSFMNQYNSQLNREYANTFPFVSSYYPLQNSPVTSAPAHNTPKLSESSKKDRDTEAVDWMMRELNDTGVLGSIIKKRSYAESEQQGNRITKRSRGKRSGQSLYHLPKLLYRYFSTVKDAS